MIEVLIVDDHRIVAEGVSQLMTGDEGIRTVGIAATLSEASQMMSELHPQVVLLDVALPDGDGIDALPELLLSSPETKVIVLTMFAEPSVIRRAMDAQAQGYLLKNTTKEELVEAIRAVAMGENYLSKEVRDQLLSDVKKAPVLTLREREIIRLMSEGCTMKEIADRLCLSFETVHSYTKNLRVKLGCNNTASMVRTAMEQHWI
ncbi:MAG: response regulator transcription factor [Bacteroidales bacterium]|jgi:DNA-binding NarL/FixJ family response regulator|nr:response regulator transcription factor [Bacteroidales bacterium]